LKLLTSCPQEITRAAVQCLVIVLEINHVMSTCANCTLYIMFPTSYMPLSVTAQCSWRGRHNRNNKDCYRKQTARRHLCHWKTLASDLGMFVVFEILLLSSLIISPDYVAVCDTRRSQKKLGDASVPLLWTGIVSGPIYKHAFAPRVLTRRTWSLYGKPCIV